MNSSTVTYTFNRPVQGPQASQVTSPQPPPRPPPLPPRPPQVPSFPRATDGVIFLSNNLYVFHLKKLNNWMSFVLIVSFDFQDNVPVASILPLLTYLYKHQEHLHYRHQYYHRLYHRKQ